MKEPLTKLIKSYIETLRHIDGWNAFHKTITELPEKITETILSDYRVEEYDKEFESSVDLVVITKPDFMGDRKIKFEFYIGDRLVKILYRVQECHLKSDDYMLSMIKTVVNQAVEPTVQSLQRETYYKLRKMADEDISIYTT